MSLLKAPGVVGCILGALVVEGAWTVCQIRKMQEEKDMAIIYATLIIKGLRTFASVPNRIKPQVREVLEALEVPELVVPELVKE